MRAARALPHALGIVGPPAALVLLYHRIAVLDSDPQRLAVTPQNFAGHLEILMAHCRPMPLRQLVERVRDGTLPDRAVAVTFDDGYADNLEYGKPLLERYDVPATVFLTTSYLRGGREFWWDDLERLLLLPGELPRTLRLRVGGLVHEWDLDGASAYAVEDRLRHADWNVERPDDPTPRHYVYRRLCGWLRALPVEERDATLRELSDDVRGATAARATHRALAADEVVRLTTGGQVDVGAHTVTHSSLSALPLATQRSEIAGSKAAIEELTGREVADFAYPFGGRSDYSRASVGLVREAGFASAYSTRPGLVGRRTHPLELPRMLVRNWDPDTFAGRLRAWLGSTTCSCPNRLLK
jgi:peptidoglycan/xylan/chitin deacetylase (PgdA/CDA1 family)